MAAVSGPDSWENIRQGVKDAETLIGQKRYNRSMMKSRQTLEYMVRELCEQAGIGGGDLAASIETLYEEGWISKSTCEHYHKIRMIGNKAADGVYDNAYDASQAHHLLSQEVVTFADGRKSKRTKSAAVRRNAKRREGTARSHRKSKNAGIDSGLIMRLVLIVAVVVLLILVIRILGGRKKPADQTTTAPVVTAEETTAPPPVETMAETTPAAVYKTSSALNVRSEPSTSGEKLGLLSADTIVDYVGAYDSDWAIINYNGEQAYVSSQYLVHD